MIPKRLKPQAAQTIKKVLDKYSGKVTIDLDNNTIEEEFDQYKAIFEAMGTITPERGNELLEEVKRTREEWD